MNGSQQSINEKYPRIVSEDRPYSPEKLDDKYNFKKSIKENLGLSRVLFVATKVCSLLGIVDHYQKDVKSDTEVAKNHKHQSSAQSSLQNYEL